MTDQKMPGEKGTWLLERARQIEARLTQKLKEWMREHLPDYEHLTLEPPEE